MNSKEIVIIINSFNRFALLKESINVLSNWPSSDFQEKCVVVVYEAGSTDGSIEWLQNEGKNKNIPIEIILPVLTDDTSFSAGINTSVAHAIKKYSNLKYLLFYETDNQILNVKPLKQALSILQQRDDIAACGFTVKKHSGKSAGIGTQFPSVHHFLLGKKLVSRFHLDRLRLNWTNINGVKFSLVDCVFTSPLLIKLEAWKQSGGFDSKAFPFSDCDVDWARRLQKLGWKMGIIEADGVIHDNKEILSAWSGRRSMQFHRARLRYFKRFHPILVYLVWPFPLIARHMLEWMAARFLIKDSIRRKQLTQQFSGLIKRCIHSYE